MISDGRESRLAMTMRKLVSLSLGTSSLIDNRTKTSVKWVGEGRA
jgi:hypothetical protein